MGVKSTNGRSKRYLVVANSWGGTEFDRDVRGAGALNFQIRYRDPGTVDRVYLEKVTSAHKHHESRTKKQYTHKMASFNPTQIFQSDVTEEKGENARLSAFVGAIAVGDLVKSTLGPKGMDKILQSA